MRYTAVLACCVLAVSSCAPAPDKEPFDAQQKKSSGWISQPIAVQWEGYKDLFSGTIWFNETEDSGEFIVKLPKNEGSCKGDYIFLTPPEASWTVTCTNDLSATGKLTGFGRYVGASGTGTDNHGRPVRFTVGQASL